MMLVPYVCCGDPSIEFSFKLAKMLAPFSSAIELGIPFSDPIADGKTIQTAANRALQNNLSLKSIFDVVEKLRKENVDVPIIFMTYYNIIFSYGKEKLLNEARRVKANGIIVPDLPFGEDKAFEEMAKSVGTPIIHLIAQNTPLKKAKAMLERESLFTYLVSTEGTTGARSEINRKSIDFIKKTRQVAGREKRLCVGFGVSSATQAEKYVEAGADGVIVGSKIIDIYARRLTMKTFDEQAALSEVEAFAKSFQLQKKSV